MNTDYQPHIVLHTTGRAPSEAARILSLADYVVTKVSDGAMILKLAETVPISVIVIEPPCGRVLTALEANPVTARIPTLCLTSHLFLLQPLGLFTEVMDPSKIHDDLVGAVDRLLIDRGRSAVA